MADIIAKFVCVSANSNSSREVTGNLWKNKSNIVVTQTQRWSDKSNHDGSGGVADEGEGAKAFLSDARQPEVIPYRKWCLFLYNTTWRYQICIAKCLYSYRDDLAQTSGWTTANEWKRSTSGGRASLKNVFVAPQWFLSQWWRWWRGWWWRWLWRWWCSLRHGRN